MSKHRRIQDGGDPAQGPPPDVANEPPSPGAGNEFPDTPEQNQAGRHRHRPDDD
jgi:hypothetical protein